MDEKSLLDLIGKLGALRGQYNIFDPLDRSVYNTLTEAIRAIRALISTLED